MTIRTLICFCCVLVAMSLSSCLGGGDPPEPPEDSIFTLTSAGGTTRVFAPAGSADPATQVQVTQGGTGSGNVATDGSVAFDAQLDAAAATLEYTKQGTLLTGSFTATTLESHVTAPHFTTGSAPNDMVLTSAGNLLIANSLDNTVTLHDTSGATLASASFPQFASPSYLAATGDVAVVARNGDNVISAHNLPGLELLKEVTLDAAGAAFAGPGELATDGRFAFVPRAQITSFSPTAYGSALVSVVDLELGTVVESEELSGRNGAVAMLGTSADEDGDATRELDLYVTSAGEVHFDENFMPFVTTDSYLDIFDIAENGGLVLKRSINLGRIGAAEMAMDGFHISGSGDATTIELPIVIGSLVAANLYSFDLLEDNPIIVRTELTAESSYSSDVFLHDDHLLATSFNTDELFVLSWPELELFPDQYPDAFQLEQDPQLLAGAISVVASGNNPGVAYVLNSVANSVSRVTLF